MADSTPGEEDVGHAVHDYAFYLSADGDIGIPRLRP